MDHFSLHSLPLILLSFYATSLLISSAPATAPAIPVLNGNKITTDPRLALLSFKSLLSDPLRSLASWNDNGSLHYCTWRGVTCGRRHPQQVVALDLASLGLTGPISPLISNLTFLRRLHLPGNELYGPIPEELGRLSRLQHLNLSINSLQGEIPATLSRCSFLQVISLGGNKLSGEIPSNLTRCFNLRILSLKENMLSGEIPADIGSLPMLQTLSLGSNNLNGHIPLLLGSSPSLTAVGLFNNSLTGDIPPFLANSSTLQFLLLQGNNLTGGIPPSLGNNTSLVKLIVNTNSLKGGIPPSLGNLSRLVLLDFSRNYLTGGIPPSLGNLFRLVLLDFSRNYLTRGIPPSLGNLSSLLYLYLYNNNLEGSIPESLGNFPNMQDLVLESNKLSNRIPSSLYKLSTITVLDAQNNNLSGTLPPDLGLTLPNLKILAMGGNQFGGPLPTSLSNASGLETIDLHDNSFSGTIPSNLGSLRKLRILSIWGNQLRAHEWSFLSSLTNCSLLEQLFLQDNKIGGALPSSVGDLSTRLEKLSIGNNQISGIIPAEIGNLVNLILLDMCQNLFVGSIPAAIGELRKLQQLSLDKNSLSGPIPSTIGNLDHLTYLYMNENELSGTIPASIGGCKGLDLLDLSHNALGGTIPRELLSLSSLTQYMDLSHNSLMGSIPMEVGHLINLGRFDVSENQLSGDIPPTLGACQHLEQLFMEGNLFQGNIPQSFIGLKGLKELDLSRNNLSGRIPYFLNSFRSLDSLNLSFNDFEGEVLTGGVFSNTSEISVLGNKKLCGGYPKLQLPSCSSNASKRTISPLKVMLPVVSAAIFLLLSFIGILYLWRKAGRVGGPSPTSTFEGARYRKISYADIYKATDGFSSANLVGAGSFGAVYRGKIGSKESIVAVKVLNLYRKGASKSFTTECEALRNIRHKNLIKIISVCSSVDHRGNDFKALVFEYMPNGSLEKWLHPEAGPERPQPHKLTLIQRLNIAIDVASALDYLHHCCQPPMVHCDLKPSNILLDDDMMAHVGDFGLAKFLAKSISAVSKNSTSSIGVKGSIGYVAPEYGINGQVSTQGDVYSFGILLLEMMTGKKPTDDMFKDGLNLRRYTEMAFLEEDVIKILDPHLVLGDEGDQAADGNIMNESITTERSPQCIYSLIRICLLCSNDTPRERIDMKDVAREINTIKVLFSTAEAHRGGSRA